MPTCAIYARVSDESQLRGESIQHQISFAKTYARRRAAESGETWETPDGLVYVDRGITGTSMVKRDAIRSLMSAAQEKQFNIVLFKGISRFARDTVDALVMLRTLLACQVRVISIEENYDSLRDSAEFVFTIHSALAQAESEKTSIRVRMGAMEKAKSGQWNGRPPDGYRLNRETKRLEIDELFAPLIREVFRLYQNGYGCRKIASLLNQQLLYTRQGKPWTQRYISRLLKNPAYAGDVVYGRRVKRLAASVDSQSLAPRRKTVLSTDGDDQVVCRDAHPWIVHRDIFDSVNQTFHERRQLPGRSGNVRLLSRGVLRCACGAPMIVKYNSRHTAYYRCCRQAESGRTVCDMPYLRCVAVEHVVLDRVCRDVLTVLDVSGVNLPAIHDNDASFHRIRDERAQYNQRAMRLFEKYGDGEIDEVQFAHLNMFLRTRIEFLDTIEKRLVNQTQFLSHVGQQDTNRYIREMMEHHLIGTSENPHLTRELMQLFVDHVAIVSAPNNATQLSIIYRFANS